MKTIKSLATIARGMLIMLGVLALLITFAAPSRSASAHSNAYVRVVHAAPGAPIVDVYVDGSKLLNDFTFGSVTCYVAVAEGSHRIQVAADGSNRSASVIDVTVSLAGGTYYTAAALGTNSSGFSLKAFVDNNWDSNTKAKVRVYHLSPNAGPVDVSVGGTKVIDGLTYTHASSYLTVAPGNYTFNVTAVNAGVTVPVSAKLRSDNVYSIFAIGFYQGNPALQFVIAAVDVD
nr:DUF4397 domain-containing protein [Ktedonobacteraceae bacterium]